MSPSSPHLLSLPIPSCFHPMLQVIISPSPHTVPVDTARFLGGILYLLFWCSAGQLFERFAVCLLNLFQQILRCEDYHPPQTLHLSECECMCVCMSVVQVGGEYECGAGGRESTVRLDKTFHIICLPLSPASPPPQVMEAHQAKLRFFKASTCQQLLERLVGHFMLLSEEVASVVTSRWLTLRFPFKRACQTCFVSFIRRSCRTGKQIRRILVSLSVCLSSISLIPSLGRAWEGG